MKVHARQSLSYGLFCLFLFLIPFETPMRIIGKKLTVLPILGLLIFTIWLSEVSVKHIQLKGFNGQRYLFATVVGYVISAVAHGFPVGEFRIIFTVFQLFIMVILFINLVFSIERLDFIGKLIIASCSINSIFAIMAPKLFRGHIMYAQQFARLEGLSTASPRLALYSLIGLVFSIMYFLRFKKGRFRILLIVCVILNFYSFIATLSLTGVFAFLLGILSWLWISTRKGQLTYFKRFLLIILMAVVLIGIGLTPGFQSTSLYLRSLNRFNQIRNKPYYYWGSMRVGAWFSSVKVITENPFFGLGPSQAEYAIAGFFPGPFENSVLASHNFILGMTTEFGLLTTVPFLLLISGVMFRLFRTIKSLPKEWDPRFKYIGRALFVSFVCIIGVGMGLDYQRHKYLWIIIALSIVYTSLVEKQRYQSQPART